MKKSINNYENGFKTSFNAWKNTLTGNSITQRLIHISVEFKQKSGKKWEFNSNFIHFGTFWLKYRIKLDSTLS